MWVTLHIRIPFARATVQLHRLVIAEGKVYLLYNGNEFGRFGFGLAVLEG